MAYTTNQLFLGASGSIGKQIMFKNYTGKTVVSKIPDMSKRVLSEKQLQANERMFLANKYAKSLFTTDEIKSAQRIRLKVPYKKSLYHALIKEYLDRPNV